MGMGKTCALALAAAWMCAGSVFGMDPARTTGGAQTLVGSNGVRTTSEAGVPGAGTQGQASELCRGALWHNGDYNGQGAQTSQVGLDLNWEEFGRISADDFYLCEGRMHRVQAIRGVMCTDAVVPKALVVITRECDGLPDLRRFPVALAAPSGTYDPADIEDFGLECIFGEVEIRETGGTTDNGFRIIEVVANFDELWLKGGNYWISFIGFSGNANPLDQFFWGYADGEIKGRPGHFADFVDGSEWEPTSDLCCGCVDFAFTIFGEYCKILLDNGVSIWENPVLSLLGDGPNPGYPGSPSLQNGTRTADKVRTADQFVVPACSPYRLCYVEGYLLTNCPRVRMDLYAGDCHCPSENDQPLYTIEANCVTEPYGPIEGNGLRIVRAQFFDFDYVLEPGRNYYISLYGLGDNSQNARAYFLYAGDCHRRCQINFDPGCIKGAPYDTSRWLPTQYDYAFLVAVEELIPAVTGGGDPTTGPACPADVNASGDVTVQDLFDFLAAYFSGCP